MKEALVGPLKTVVMIWGGELNQVLTFDNEYDKNKTTTFRSHLDSIIK